MTDELTRATDQRDRLARALGEALRLCDCAMLDNNEPEDRARALAKVRDVLRGAPQVILAEGVQVSEAHADAAVLRGALREIHLRVPDAAGTAEVALMGVNAGRRLLEAAYNAREALEPLVLAAARRDGRQSPGFHLLSVGDAVVDLAVEAASNLPARPRSTGPTDPPEGWVDERAAAIVGELVELDDALVQDGQDHAEVTAFVAGELLYAFRRGAAAAWGEK